MKFEVTYRHPDHEKQRFVTEIPPGHRGVIIPITAQCLGIEFLKIERLPAEEEDKERELV